MPDLPVRKVHKVPSVPLDLPVLMERMDRTEHKDLRVRWVRQALSDHKVRSVPMVQRVHKVPSV